MKVLTGIGIRPDIIRLSEIIREFDKWFDHVVVDTGQHWDENLNAAHYKQLGLREPDYRLDGRADTQIQQIGKIAAGFEASLEIEKPDVVVILGDNNSSLAMAITAANLNIPIAHIESGGRSFNWAMPEEKNRSVVDHLSDVLFCYTEEHKANLVREGIDPRRAWVVGNPIVDVLEANINKTTLDVFKKLPIKVQEGDYVLVTCHRNENVTDEVALNYILDQLEEIGDYYDLPVLIVEMPKLSQQMEKFGYVYPDNVHPIEPLGYLDFLSLQKYARFIITDSGTIPEDSYAMGKPTIQIREKTERVELLNTGWTILVAPCGDIVTAAKMLDENKYTADFAYKTNVAQKIARILAGNAMGAWKK